MVRSTLLQLLSQAGPSGKNRCFQVLHDPALLHASVEGQRRNESEEKEFVRRYEMKKNLIIAVAAWSIHIEKILDKRDGSPENITPVIYV